MTDHLPGARRFLRPAATRRLATGLLVLAGPGLAACTSSGTGSPDDPSASQAVASSRVAHVTVTSAHGCTVDPTEFAAGGITFEITNRDATAVSEVELLDGQQIVGEKENLPPGLHGSFAVRVDAGTYTLYCPGATPERSTITVQGRAADERDRPADGLFALDVPVYSRYVSTQAENLVRAVAVLNRALHGTDLAAAQDAYLGARPFYERIEPVAESFTVGTDNLDADIDRRSQDVPAGQPWTGFHPIERGLFQRRSLAGLPPLGEGLLANVRTLRQKVQGQKYQPFELANGAAELLDEVATAKITGEEEKYAHSDLSDFKANVEGAEQAFGALLDGLRQIDADLAETIDARFEKLDLLLAKYFSTGNASGYVLYGTLTRADKQKLSAAVSAVQEPLSRVAAKVASR